VELQETYIGLAIATVAVLHSCTTDHAMFYVSWNLFNCCKTAQKIAFEKM